MVRFSRHGERPHQLAWQNLSALFPNDGKIVSSARQKQTKLFKEIISNDPNSVLLFFQCQSSKSINLAD